MKIDHLDIRDSNVWKTIRKGRAVALAVGISLSLVGCIGSSQNSQDQSSEQMEAMIDEVEIQTGKVVSVQDMNHLNLILCNSDCNSDIFDTTVYKLKEMGVSVTTAVSGDAVLSRENSTVVTLAGSIYNSDSTVILGPYNNDLNNQSDILALSMQAGLKQEGVKVDGIRCGILKVEQEENLTHRVPTATEKAIAPSGSFVSIAIGDQISSQEADNISDGIISGLARATYQIGLNSQEDYIFRISPNQSTNSIAEQLGVNEEVLVENNDNLKNDLIQMDEAIFHPQAFKETAFDATVPFEAPQKSAQIQTK